MRSMNVVAQGSEATGQQRTGERSRGRKRMTVREHPAPPRDFDSDQADAGDIFQYTHPKPPVLGDGLFMWERVAAFSVPTQVVELELLCRDVSRQLKESNTGTRLMQRYWNAQWCRMVWKEEELPDAKRYITPSTLSHSEGKQRWKKYFVEEYPLYCARLYQGKGANNNALNEAKVLFHREILNDHKTAAELEKMELTLEEAQMKEQRKRGVNVEFEETVQPGASSAASPGRERRHGDHESKKPGKREKGRMPVASKLPNETYTRSDYKQDFRIGARKEKHQKGKANRWDAYDAFGDYDY